MTSVGKEKEYEVTRRKQIERKQKMVATISIVSFAGSMVFGMGQLFSSAWQTPNAASNNKEMAPESSLVAEARGYELVLEREPNNQAALEGLMNVKLQMGDSKAAISPLEKLVKLNPNRSDYKNALEKLKQQVSASESSKYKN